MSGFLVWVVPPQQVPINPAPALLPIAA